MFAPPPPPTLDAADNAPPARSREALRLAVDLETSLGQARALETRLWEVAAETRRARALRAHWWTRLGRRLGFLTAESQGPGDNASAEVDEEPLPERLHLMEPSALAALSLQVRRLQAEARERERRHAREAASWRQKTLDLAARVWLENYRRDVRRRLWSDWPGWLWWRLQTFWRTRRRLARRRLSRRRLQR